MNDWIRAEVVRQLDLDQYLARFQDIQESLSCSTLKLESAQHFIEPGNDSWELFRDNHWEAALEVVMGMETEIYDSFRDLQSRGITTKRLRLIEEPLSPYVQWELHILNVRARAGEDIRVMRNGEAAIALNIQPRELLFLDEIAMFDIKYSINGLLIGANEYRYELDVAELRDRINELFEKAEPLSGYFDKRVKSLPPPQMP